MGKCIAGVYESMDGSQLHKRCRINTWIMLSRYRVEMDFVNFWRRIASSRVIVYIQVIDLSNMLHKNLLHQALSHIHAPNSHFPSHPIHKSVLAPLNTVQRNALLHQLPKRTQFSQECDSFLDCFQDVVNLTLSRESSNSKSDTAVCALVTAAKGTENVAGLEGGRCTGTTR